MSSQQTMKNGSQTDSTPSGFDMWAAQLQVLWTATKSWASYYHFLQATPKLKLEVNPPSLHHFTPRPFHFTECNHWLYVPLILIVHWKMMPRCSLYCHVERRGVGSKESCLIKSLFLWRLVMAQSTCAAALNWYNLLIFSTAEWIEVRKQKRTLLQVRSVNTILKQ